MAHKHQYAIHYQTEIQCFQIQLCLSKILCKCLSWSWPISWSFRTRNGFGWHQSLVWWYRIWNCQQSQNSNLTCNILSRTIGWNVFPAPVSVSSSTEQAAQKDQWRNRALKVGSNNRHIQDLLLNAHGQPKIPRFKNNITYFERLRLQWQAHRQNVHTNHRYAEPTRTLCEY